MLLIARHAGRHVHDIGQENGQVGAYDRSRQTESRVSDAIEELGAAREAFGHTLSPPVAVSREQRAHRVVSFVARTGRQLLFGADDVRTSLSRGQHANRVDV